jgi:protein SCO1
MEALMRHRAVTSLALLLTLASLGVAQARGPQRGEAYFTNLPVINQDGKQLKFYDDVIKDKIFVISFIFTACREVCPITTARLAMVEERLGDAVGRDVFLYSISVDPANDTPEKLKNFAKAFHAGPGWQFLTGKYPDMRVINGKLGERMIDLSSHRNEVLIGNGRTGEWQRDNLFGDIDRVIENIRAMDPKWREQTRISEKTNAAPDLVAYNAPPGQALYTRLCAGCHTVGQGDRVGPDLNNLTSRRSRAWIVKYLQDPKRMQDEKDPVALDLVSRFPVVRMPNMQLSDVDADDLLSFIELQMYRVNNPATAQKGGGHHHRHH